MRDYRISVFGLALCWVRGANLVASLPLELLYEARKRVEEFHATRWSDPKCLGSLESPLEGTHLDLFSIDDKMVFFSAKGFVVYDRLFNEWVPRHLRLLKLRCRMSSADMNLIHVSIPPT